MSFRIVELMGHFPAEVRRPRGFGSKPLVGGGTLRDRTVLPSGLKCSRRWQGRSFPVAVLDPLLLGRRTLSVSIRLVGHVDVLGVNLGHHELAKLGELLYLLGSEHVPNL